MFKRLTANDFRIVSYNIILCNTIQWHGWDGTTLGDRFTSASHTVINFESLSSLCFKRRTGKCTLKNSVLVLQKAYPTLNMNTNFEILLEYSTSCILSCFFPLVNAGISSLALCKAMQSPM